MHTEWQENDTLIIDSIAALEAIYRDLPTPASTAKETDRLTDAYRRLIAASPFMALATVGPEGLDCSPRGDNGSVVRVLDERTLALPDRRGNNRIDSLRNIVRDPRVALLFLIPGSGTTFRVNGRAAISADRDLCQSFAVDGKAPRTVIIITIAACYFQCARAIVRAGLWKSETWPDPALVPTPGAILDGMTKGEIDADAYDAEWPGRAAHSLW
jgi:PPOX class probable FMN-dependent enzyme